MAKTLPVVFIHEGCPYYLRDTLLLAGKYNGEVTLLGDKSNRKICMRAGVEWNPIQDYGSGLLDAFTDDFLNLSPNTYHFEYLCFKRYFILYEYMVKKGLEECVMCDSDLCVFMDFREYDFSQCEASFNHSDKDDVAESPHCSYWKREALLDFLHYTIDQYHSHTQKLASAYMDMKRRKMWGGISDMILLRMWGRDKGKKVHNSFYPFHDVVIDHNIGISHGYRYDEKYHIKNVVFLGQIPYFIRQDGHSRIRAGAIHCQGESKRYIKMLALGKCSPFWMALSNKRWFMIICSAYTKLISFI